MGPTKNLQPGDIFCTHSSGKLGSAINFIQKFHAVDNESIFSHAGIITDGQGGTFESSWTIRRCSLEKYFGKPILIGRHKHMTEQLAKIALRLMADYEGRIYPVHRLFFHLAPPVAKHITTGRYLVCSELVSTFLYFCRVHKFWKGITPDHIADMISNYNTYDIIYSGEFTEAAFKSLRGEYPHPGPLPGGEGGRKVSDNHE
jgi:hypothetical protein